jgi:hypothetical protein
LSHGRERVVKAILSGNLRSGRNHLTKIGIVSNGARLLPCCRNLCFCKLGDLAVVPSREIGA